MNILERHALEDSQLILHDAKVAISAIDKGSKLRVHYLKLVVMSNVLRAFVTLYHLEEKYKDVQENLLRTLQVLNLRKQRGWLTSDKIHVQIAYNAYMQILESASEDQLQEVMQFVEQNLDAGHWTALH